MITRKAIATDITTIHHIRSITIILRATTIAITTTISTDTKVTVGEDLTMSAGRFQNTSTIALTTADNVERPEDLT